MQRGKHLNEADQVKKKYSVSCTENVFIGIVPVPDQRYCNSGWNP